MLIDSHCHLDYPDFSDDRDAVIERARAAGVGLMLTISCKVTEADKIIALAETYEDVVCSIGIHPHEAGTEPETDAQTLVDLSRHPKVVGIGETGLDYYYEHSPRDKQQRNFRQHIEAARQSGLPLIVHARDADEDTAEILEAEFAKAPFPGLIHCFTAGPELARRALDIGFYISISGIATFKSAQNLRDVIKTVPLNRLLVETDAPWLAPTPHRGKRNEPSFVKHTAALVADVKGVPDEEIERQTTQNFFTLFSKAKSFGEAI
ncbi:MAG: TatD family hydrolase [Parvibaculales bacterium]